MIRIRANFGHLGQNLVKIGWPNQPKAGQERADRAQGRVCSASERFALLPLSGLGRAPTIDEFGTKQAQIGRKAVSGTCFGGRRTTNNTVQ